MSASQQPKPSRRKLTNYVVVAAVTAFIALLAYGLLAKAADTTIDDALSRGEAPQAPGFALPLLEPGLLAEKFLRGPVGMALADGQLDLEELRGTPVVLNFWASWCVPCRDEAPVLQRGWERFGPRGVLLIGLDMQDLSGDARDFLREFNVTYPTIREPSDEIAGRYGATGIPETFFIDRQGQVVGHAIGALNEPQLRAGVAAALRSRIVGTIAGGAFRPQR